MKMVLKKEIKAKIQKILSKHILWTDQSFEIPTSDGKVTTISSDQIFWYEDREYLVGLINELVANIEFYSSAEKIKRNKKLDS